MSQTANLYQRFRAHQKALWNDGGMLTIYPSGRTEFSFGGSAYGQHALCAFADAKRHAAFLNRHCEAA